MTSKYNFSHDELCTIVEARNKNKDQRVIARLYALELKAIGKTGKDI